MVGPIGDGLYGFYDRSENILVRDMGSVEKRRGYERAFDELFDGAAGVALGRDESSLVWLAADSEGIRVLSSLPQTEFTGFTLDHPGFLADDFTRSDNTDIQTGTNLPWIEGQDSTENSAHTLAAVLRIASNQLRLNQADYASSPAGADWNMEAPTIFHTLRVEMDMSAVALTTNEAINIYMFMGLPDFIVDAVGVPVKDRIWVADAAATISAGGATDHCWAGIAGKFRLVGKSSSTMEAEVEVWEFASEKAQDVLEDRKGKIGYTSKKTSANALSDASCEVTWVMEIGRKQGVNRGWVTRIDIYQNTTIATLEAGTNVTGSNSTLWKSIECEERQINGDAGGGYVYNLPMSGKGGYSGVRVSVNGSPSSGSARIERIKPALGFLQDQFPE